MITNFLLLAFLSLGTLEASIFNLSVLKNDKSFPKIVSSNRKVRFFGAISAPVGAPVDEEAHVVNPGMPAAPRGAYLEPSSTPRKVVTVGKRVRVESHTSEQDLEKYIQNELAFNAFKKHERRVALRSAIEFIANNDIEGFKAYAPQFEAAFGREYHMFRRGPTKSEYMMHYIIRFGATNFFSSWCYAKRSPDENSNIEGAFEYLIATKPLNVVLKFLKERRYSNRESVQKAISEAIKKRYPDLHFLDYIVFESPTFFDDAHKIFKADSEEDKLLALKSYLELLDKIPIVLHFRQLRFLEIPSRYPDYFMNLSVELRFYLAKMAIKNENLGALTKIFDLDPELVFHSRETTLFAFAAEIGATSMIKFFMDIVPEMATLSVEGNISPVALSIQNDIVKNLNAFEDCGIDLSQALPYKDNLYTPVQLAFLEKSYKTFNFFVDKYCFEYVMVQLLEIFVSTNEIMKHVVRPEVRIGLIETLRDKLGFNLNDGYYFEGQTGNISIFMEVSDYWKRQYKLKFNLEN